MKLYIKKNKLCGPIDETLISQNQALVNEKNDLFKKVAKLNLTLSKFTEGLEMLDKILAP